MQLATLSLLALTSLPTPAPRSVSSAQDSPSAPQVTDERARELNRILYLAGGGAVRAKARWVDGQWEYRARGEWYALPEQVVARVCLEREVLAQAKELGRKADKSDPAARAQLGDWMLRNGLLEEGVTELDRALRLDPDDPSALAILRHPPVPLAFPGASAEELDDAVRLAASAPRALQEGSIAVLAQRPDTASVMAALNDALASHSARIRTFAALAMHRLDPQASVRPLLQRAVLDGSEDVRVEAARALGATAEPAVTIPVVRALGSTSAAVRSNAIEALGEMGFPAAIEPLISRLAALSAPQGGGGWRAPASNIFVGRQVAYIQDFDVEVAQFASIADPQVNTLVEGSVLDVRVIGVWETSVAIESRRIRGALRKLAGEDPGNSNKSWIDWWEQNKARFGVRTPARPTTPPND